MIFLLSLACSKEIPEEAWNLSPVYGVPNLDDDNQNGIFDGEEELSADENDLAKLRIPQVFFSNKKDDQKLRIVQNDDGFRIYQNGALKSNSTEDNFYLEHEEESDLLLEIEFLDYNQSKTISLQLEEPGEVLKKVDIELYSAPLLVGHHLQPAEFLVSMEYRGNDGNQEFVDAFADVLGDRFTAYALGDYEFDVWIQDEIEFGILIGDGHQTSTVIDSIRDRGLAPLAEQELVGSDVGRGVWGSGQENSQDSFGNLEATPPITVDGTTYPFGRIYYGKYNSFQMTRGLKSFLDEQEIQAPIELDVGFLCVGHVDEFVTFIPDPSAPQGHRLYVTDIDKGYEFLNGLERSHSLPLYGSEYGYDNVGDILDDNELRELNEEIQATYIEPNIARFKAEFGLTEEEIVRVPMIFEQPWGCGGSTATLLPGVVNMAVFTHEDQVGADLFIPDPFFRSNLNDTTTDPYINMFKELLPETVTPHWVNDWEWYHVQLGEVHCGSNIKRQAVNNWWEK